MKRALICGLLICGLGLLVVSGCGAIDASEEGGSLDYATVTFAAASAANLAFSVNATWQDGPPCGLEKSVAFTCQDLTANGQATTTNPLCSGLWDFRNMLLWETSAGSCPTGGHFAWCEDLTNVQVSNGNNTIPITCHSVAQGTVIFDVALDP